MKFTIGYSKGFTTDELRLKNNDTFRSVANKKEVYEDDRLFSNWYEADRWLINNPTVELEGESVQTKPKSVLLGSATISIKFHRDFKPKKPHVTKDEIRSLLANGNDDHYNMLVLDHDGIPHLIPSPSFAYAVRLEGFQAGNGYVGPSSSLNHFDETYIILLEAWLLHLQSDRSIYKDYHEGKLTEQELINAILKEIENI